MTVEVGGAGTVGVAFEAVLGTYVVPVKWIPVRSESLQKMEGKVYRTNIRGLAGRSGVIQGYTHTEGDIVFEVTSDVLPYFLYAARYVPVKTGAMAPFTYTFTPAHVAKASTGAGAVRKTLSMLVTRGGNPRGFVGLSVGQMTFTVDAGVLLCTASMVGTDEGTQSTGTPAWAASTVFGPGKVTLEIPTATPRADMDTFSLAINNNLTPSNRLNGQRAAAYQNWGERETTLTCEADFDTLTDYNVFNNQTIQAITIKAINTALSDEMSIVLNASAGDSYAYPLASLGDVNRASLAFHAFHNTSDEHVITVKSNEDVVIT